MNESTKNEAKETVSDKFDTLKTEAGEQLNAASEKLGELKDQVVNKVNEMAAEVDVDGLKTQASAKLAELKAEAGEVAATASAKFDSLKAEAGEELSEFKEGAAEKLTELKAEAAETLEAAEKKFDELKAEASEQFDELKEKAKDAWNKLF
nr:hypothetical protein [uncultured Arsenicibacter sp.]